ncbi:MAG: cupin domain-containing protein [Sphingomicrobium sp.]
MAKTMISAAAAAAMLVSASPALAQPPENLAAAQLEWREMFSGVEFAPAYGDWEKQTHGKYVRFVPAAKVPMHMHSNPYHGVMISGRMANLYDGGKRVEIDPGDYWYVAGARPHGHECLSSEPCFFYTYGDSLWDIELVEAE